MVDQNLIAELDTDGGGLDAELAQFYNRIKQRHHPRVAARKAIVAVARKLTARIYCVLKEQRNYQIH